MIRFTIPGPPIGKGRARCSCVGGKPRMYTPAETRAYEATVGAAGLLAVQRHKAKGQPWPMTTKDEYTLLVRVWHVQDKRKRPDLANVVKAVEDGLNGVAWRDDRYEVASSSEAEYSPGETPRVEVWVMPYRMRVVDAALGLRVAA